MDDDILPVVYVQVKSSNHAIWFFEREKKRHFGITGSELDNWLMENGLLIINGAQSEKYILDKFVSKLNKIRNYKILEGNPTGIPPLIHRPVQASIVP